MQLQADQLQVPVERPVVAETTALGRRVPGRAGHRGVVVAGGARGDLAARPAVRARRPGTSGLRPLARGRAAHLGWARAASEPGTKRRVQCCAAPCGAGARSPAGCRRPGAGVGQALARPRADQVTAGSWPATPGRPSLQRCSSTLVPAAVRPARSGTAHRRGLGEPELQHARGVGIGGPDLGLAAVAACSIWILVPSAVLPCRSSRHLPASPDRDRADRRHGPAGTTPTRSCRRRRSRGR